ncbi:MAG: choice-of-anchor B family protein [Bacteroidota bacterium]
MLRRLALLAACLGLTVGLASSASAQTPCTGGTAGAYDCDGVDLMAHLPLSTFASSGSGAPSSGNDIWGWTHAASGREFALMGVRNGVAFVEVTTPEAPVYIGKLPTATSSSSWRDVKTYADHAFIVSEASGHGMQVFDLTRLLSASGGPVTFTADARYTGFGSAHNVVIDDVSGYAYGVGVSAGTCGGGGLHMVDITTPTSPSYAGCYDGDGYTHDAQCLVYGGPDTEHTGKQICVASNEDTVTIVDVTDKSSPVQLARGFYPNPGYTHQGWFTDDQRYFVVNDELDTSSGGTRTIVMDLVDLDSPSFDFFHFSALTSTDHNLYLRDGYVFQSNYRAGLRILDASAIGTGSLTEVGFFDTFPGSNSSGFNGQWSNYPYFPSGTVIASDISNGLFVLRPDVLQGPVGSGPIEFTAPASGETLTAGSTYTVTWDPGGVDPSATLRLNLKSASQGNLTIASSVPNSGSYSWAVSGTLPTANDYRIIGVYTDPATGDKERAKTNPFSITGGGAPPTPISVTSPEAGDVLSTGTTATITWDAGDIPPSTTLTIRLLAPGSNTRIGKNVVNDGAWDWAVPADQPAGTGYRILLVYTDPTTGAKVKPRSDAFEIASSLARSAEAFGLQPVSPNPVQGQATVSFSLAEAGDAEVTVLDARGREVARLASGWHAAGAHSATWTPGALGPGTYLVRLTAGGKTVVQRAAVVR